MGALLVLAGVLFLTGGISRLLLAARTFPVSLRSAELDRLAVRGGACRAVPGFDAVEALMELVIPCAPPAFRVLRASCVIASSGCAAILIGSAVGPFRGVNKPGLGQVHRHGESLRLPGLGEDRLCQAGSR